MFLLLAPLIGNTITGNFVRGYQLSLNGIHSEAVIVKLTPENHGSFCYRFEAGGRQYEGIGLLSGLKEPKVGNIISITYSAKDPAISKIGSVVQSDFIKGIIGLAAYVIPLLLLIAYFRGIEKSNTGTKQ